MGITLIGDASDEVDDLLKQADMAMYRSKEQGRNMICVFDPAMERNLASRAALIADLRRALECREFELFYQAQVDGDGRVLGCEALVRWRHPQRGLISPAEFIPVAESGGMILELGARALEEACRRLAIWQERPGLDDLTIAVNVSSRQFADPQFVRVVQDVLQSTRINPSRLKLEITESAAMEKVSEVIEKLMTLKALGIQISLDDFGTGLLLPLATKTPAPQPAQDRQKLCQRCSRPACSTPPSSKPSSTSDATSTSTSSPKASKHPNSSNSSRRMVAGHSRATSSASPCRRSPLSPTPWESSHQILLPGK